MPLALNAVFVCLKSHQVAKGPYHTILHTCTVFTPNRFRSTEILKQTRSSNMLKTNATVSRQTSLERLHCQLTPAKNWLSFGSFSGCCCCCRCRCCCCCCCCSCCCWCWCCCCCYCCCFCCRSPSSLLWGSRKKKAGHGMLWPRSWSLSAMCPPCIHFGRASKPCPARVCHLSTLCPPRVRFGRASKSCPPCVRHVFAWAAGSSLVRLVFVRLESALASPPNLGRHALVSASPCIRLVSALAAPPGVASPMYVPAPCLFFVFFCPLVVRSLSALCRFLAGCSVSIVARLSRCLCGCAFARSSSGHL